MATSSTGKKFTCPHCASKLDNPFQVHNCRPYVKKKVRPLWPFEQSIELLKRARNLLAKNSAPKAADKVRSALKSAEGALRNARCQNTRVAI
jgi:hypothetical protein